MHLSTYFALAIYFIAMLAIGVFAYRKSQADVEGYMLGGRQLSPSVTALSAGASDMSGWILMGLPGALYLSGISAGWIAIGLIIGAWLNYLLVGPRLRVYTEVANNSVTIPEFFENRFNDNTRMLRSIASVVIIVFFTLYTSSGLVAGGKLFESFFQASFATGVLITAAVVVAYTLIGGFMAVSLTDFVQGSLMLIALVLVPGILIVKLGGPVEAISTVADISPLFLDPFSAADSQSAIGIVAIISLMSWGLGYVGQPHIIVRFMAIDSVKSMPTARRIGMSWMILSVLGAALTGLLGMAYVSTQTDVSIDPETVFIFLSGELFPPAITGFLLAAILAAIMSTISSQLLVTSSSLASDFFSAVVKKDASQSQILMISRASVLLVAFVAGTLALGNNGTILSLVSNAWAGFGAAFGPLVIFSLFKRDMTRQAALAGMLVGAITVLLWIYLPVTVNNQSLSQIIYEIVPGFILSSIAILLVSKLTRVEASVTETFDTFKQRAS